MLFIIAFFLGQFSNLGISSNLYPSQTTFFGYLTVNLASY
jgi:hypothetical protein